MPIERRFVNLDANQSRNITGLRERGVPAAYSDAARVETADCVFLYVSGQTPVDDNGELVGKTMKDQTRQVLARLRRIVEHEGGTMSDIVRVRVFATDIRPDSLREIHEARNEVFPANSRPASTLVQISGIIRDGGMIEIDADVVIPK